MHSSTYNPLAKVETSMTVFEFNRCRSNTILPFASYSLIVVISPSDANISTFKVFIAGLGYREVMYDSLLSSGTETNPSQ